IDDLVIDIAGYEARIAGRRIDLTHQEFELLRYLAQHRGRVFTRQALLERAWGYQYAGGTRTVDIHVRRVRSKLGTAGELIETVREQWASEAMQKAADQWLQRGTPEAHKRLLAAVTQGVIAAHDAIIAETKADRGKTGMGTTIVGAMVVGGEMVFAHCGDSR